MWRQACVGVVAFVWQTSRLTNRAVARVERFCAAVEVGTTREGFVRFASQRGLELVDESNASDGELSAFDRVIYRTVSCTETVRLFLLDWPKWGYAKQ